MVVVVVVLMGVCCLRIAYRVLAMGVAIKYKMQLII